VCAQLIPVAHLFDEREFERKLTKSHIWLQAFALHKHILIHFERKHSGGRFLCIWHNGWRTHARIRFGTLTRGTHRLSTRTHTHKTNWMTTLQWQTRALRTTWS
jgi:hypothetical protein